MSTTQATASGPLASGNEELSSIGGIGNPVDVKDPRETVDDHGSDASSEHAQHGVKKIEAITLVWTKKSLGFAYIMMWLLYFVNGFNQSLNGSLSAYVTSDFESHSLIPLISVVSSVMASATYMPLAKVLNLFDRSVGFAVMAGFATLGLVLTAVCNSIGTYCAAQVFYSIGYAGMTFSIDVITADTSSLRDRGLAYAFTSSPYIITAYAGPAAAEKFYAKNWRWAYGAFAIILPVLATPMVGILVYAKRQAEKQGLLPKKVASGRTFFESVKHYVIEFDILGTFLLAAGLIIFLLPFNISETYAVGWASAACISMLVIGFVLLVGFGINERYFAPVPFLQWNILRSRTVIGTCALDVCYQISYYCWAYYYQSFLRVNSGVSIAEAGYIQNIFDVVSGIWLFVVGLLIRKTSRFRWLLFWIVPLYLLGLGLMIYFRKPDQKIGYLIMCQLFMAFSGGALIIVMQVAMLAASDHQNMAGTLAFLNVFGTIGGAIGGSVSAAVWQATFPQALQRYLPADALSDWENIYADIEEQLSYPKGSAARYAIEKSYALAQSHMVICGVAVMSLSLVWMFVIRDIRLERSQTKGVLF